jgi:adenylate cyclase class IV
LEIERKFWYDFDIEKKLLQVGAKQIDHNSKQICDEYYDNTDNYFMLLNDYLLRFRNKNKISAWQLKYPSKFSQKIENYYEIEDKKQIVESIHSLAMKAKVNLPLKSTENNFECVSFEELIKVFNLKCYARINSTRYSYLYENVRIDLDETDFGYKLGEIELMLDNQSSTNENMTKTYERISELTSKLG